MLAKKLVILANSIKHGDRCVAGKCLSTGRWVRPVSTADGGALTFNQIQCRNSHGIFPAKNLQKVTIPLESSVPLLNQPENYLIAANSEWQQNNKICADELVNMLDYPISLWGEGNRVSYAAIEQSQIVLEESLCLIQTENLRFEYSQYGKPRAVFFYRGVKYDLPITDQNISSIVREQRKILGILCISLAQEYYGYCYKVVAAIY
jgi:hypothetical protein